MSYTPGPWTLYVSREISVCANDGGIYVARVSVRENARLIAAAPDLLEELRNMVECWEEGDDYRPSNAAMAKAKAAIAKAEGKP